MGQAPAALRVADRILGESPTNVQAMNLKGQALRDMSKVEASETCLSKALDLEPKNAQTLNNLGVVAKSAGDTDKAAECFRLAVRFQPTSPIAHRNLANAITYSGDEPHLEEMRKFLASSDPTDPKMAPLYFAFFKALDDLDARAEAYEFLKRGNELAKEGLDYDFQRDAIPYALTKALFERDVEQLKAHGRLSPIFVTGLPRSGTTLVERILSRSVGVQPCGELTVVQGAVGRLLRGILEREKKTLTGADIRELRSRILDGLFEYSDGAPVIIDKMPQNFRWIGFILTALPEAQIVHISRDARAVAWSLYQRMFAAAGIGFVYDPSDIARYMVMHDDLMNFWRLRFPGRIIDVEYSELVTNPTAVTKRLARETGLEWTVDWLKPEDAKNPVLTASSEQVRKPIYKDSNNQWKRYKHHIAPLLSALDAAGLV